jgi:hypothetical protein
MLTLQSDFIRHSLISLEGKQLYLPASKACFHVCFALSPPSRFRPAAKGTYPLGTPNSAPPNAVALVSGSTTPYDHLNPLWSYFVLIKVLELVTGSDKMIKFCGHFGIIVGQTQEFSG